MKRAIEFVSTTDWPAGLQGRTRLGDGREGGERIPWGDVSRRRRNNRDALPSAVGMRYVSL